MERVEELRKQIQCLGEQMNKLNEELKKEMEGSYRCSCGKRVMRKTAHIHNISKYHIINMNRPKQIIDSSDDSSDDD